MHLEQQEDQAQFKLKNASASIKERRRRGQTWYPITITQEDIGFGARWCWSWSGLRIGKTCICFRWGRLAQLLALGEPTDHEQRPLTIGVIAPYRAQINYLKDAIEDSAVLNDLLLQRRLSVGTVDSFQGQERDIIAITLTRSNPQGEIGFLSDIRRMNVGMTRARRKLLLVGDSSTLCSHPFFVELLAYVKGVGGYRMSHEIATKHC